MAATMKKTDIKYEEDNIKNVDWNAVRALTGKSVPQVALQTIKTLAKSNPKAYVKVGLIKNDLYLRVKEGSKHLDDIKLAANWTPPSGGGGMLDESDRGVKTVVDQVKGMLVQMKNGEKQIKVYHKRASDLAYEASTRADACAGQSEASHRKREIASIRKAQTDIARVMTDAQAEYDNEVFKPFSDMRTKGFLPWPDNTDPKVKKSWGSDYYQSQMKPVYARATDILAEIRTFVDETDDALDTAETADRDGGRSTAAVDKRIAALVKKLEAEWIGACDKAFLSDGRGENFNQALDNIREFMKNKYDAVTGGTMDLDGILEQLGNIGSKLTILDKSEKAIVRRGKTIAEIAGELKTLAKDNPTNANATNANDRAKVIVKNLADLQKRVTKEKKAGMDLLKKGKEKAKKA